MSCMSLHQILARCSILAKYFMQKFRRSKGMTFFVFPGWTMAKWQDCSQPELGTQVTFALPCYAMPNPTLKYPEIWTCKHPSWK